MTLTRRGFLQGCSAAIAALAGVRFNSLAFADPGSNQDILIVLSLRGGMDGLSLLPPLEGDDRRDYDDLRPNLKIPIKKALAVGDGHWGFHPAAAPLRDLFQDGKVAIVHNAGMDRVNRSHFQAISWMELGTPGSVSIGSGWLTRHLRSATNLPVGMLMPSLAIGYLKPQSFLDSVPTLNMASAETFRVEPVYRPTHASCFGAGDTWLHRSGRAAIEGLNLIANNVSGTYVPENGAVYPPTELGNHLKALAQLIKADLGLQVASVEFGNWDTHAGQAEAGSSETGRFAELLATLANALGAFFQDLDGAGSNNVLNRLTLVIQSEFGREVAENDDLGTEHGWGNLMLVLGGQVNGGFHGQWTGLSQLSQGADLRVTTDYRRVLSEILIRRLGNHDLTTVFPGYSCYQPLGVVRGQDGPASLFCNGFESGDTSSWSTRVG